MRTRGREGVQNPKNFAYVLNGSSQTGKKAGYWVRQVSSRTSDIPRTTTYSIFTPDRVVLLESRALLPELGKDAAEQVHGLERLLGQPHVGVDGVHPLLELLELLSLVVEHDERLDAGVLGILAQRLHAPRRLQRLVRHLQNSIRVQCKRSWGP